MTRLCQCIFLSLLAICGIISCSQSERFDLGFAADFRKMAIINGEKCEGSLAQSAVEIIVESEVDFSVMGKIYDTSHTCSGTLIAPDVVLTAAHCLDESSLTLGTGKILKRAYYVTSEEDLRFMDLTSAPMLPRDSVKVVSWIQHENYASRDNAHGLENDHDVGLVFLERPLRVRPAILITKEEAAQIAVGNLVSIAGWGRNVEAPFFIFDPGAQQISGIKYCGISRINEVGTHEMQIGSDKKSTRKCYGDSGGPTFMNVGTRFGLQERLIGITARSYDDTNCAKGGVDTRVDVWLDWIDDKMRSGCRSGTRVWCEVEGIIKADA